METKGFLNFEIIINVLVSSCRFIWISVLDEEYTEAVKNLPYVGFMLGLHRFSACFFLGPFWQMLSLSRTSRASYFQVLSERGVCMSDVGPALFRSLITMCRSGWNVTCQTLAQNCMNPRPACRMLAQHCFTAWLTCVCLPGMSQSSFDLCLGWDLFG